VINNDETVPTIIKKKNYKRFMKLQSGARKRFKNELPNLVHYGDSELISEIEIGNANRNPEAAGAKIGTLKIDSVNVITEILTHQRREIRQIISSCHENIIIYLENRLRNLEAGKRKSDDTVKNRDCTIINLNN
jgi:hypothetical protein